MTYPKIKEMRLPISNLIFLYRESRDNDMESGVGNRESKGTQRPFDLFVKANHIGIIALMVVVAFDNLTT